MLQEVTSDSKNIPHSSNKRSRSRGAYRQHTGAIFKAGDQDVDYPPHPDHHSPFYEIAVALNEIPVEELETINPFTLAL
jgi:hypothetical protein